MSGYREEPEVARGVGRPEWQCGQRWRLWQGWALSGAPAWQAEQLCVLRPILGTTGPR